MQKTFYPYFALSFPEASLIVSQRLSELLFLEEVSGNISLFGSSERSSPALEHSHFKRRLDNNQISSDSKVPSETRCHLL